MKICEVYLENFKNHAQETFTFSEGTNAVCGPNGSGKTSILEAIAWALFDYLPYKNQDHIIKLTGEGIGGMARPQAAKVQVTFISNLDEKEYIVLRSTKRQYYVVDKETNERMAEGKREVLPFLVKHYNLSGNINLDELFTNTIGVPQGNFTSIFKDTATNRKKIFDKVLNIEDYRNTFDKLRDFKSFLKDQLNEINQSIAVYESDMGRIEAIQENIDTTSKDNAKLLKEKEILTGNIKTQEKTFQTFEALKESINKLSADFEKLELTKKHISQSYEDISKKVTQAKEDSSKLKALEPEYKLYLKTKEELEKLEYQKDHYIKLNNQLNQKEKEAQNIDSVINTYEEKLNNYDNLMKQINKLEPECIKQESLEKDLTTLEKQKDELKTIETNLKYAYKEIEDLKDQLTFIEEELEGIEKHKKLAEKQSEIENSYKELQKIIAETKSLITENNKFLQQVKGGLCPFLKEQCKNISEEQNLESYFEEKLTDLEKDLEASTKTFKNIEKDLTTSNKAKESYQKLQLKQEEKEKLGNKIARIKEDISNTEKSKEDLSTIPKKLNNLINEIKKLGSPAEKIKVLKEQLPDKTKIEKSLTSSQKRKEILVKDTNNLFEEIKKINFDANKLTETKNSLIKLEDPYKKYIELHVTVKELNNLEQQLNKLEKEASENTLKVSEVEKGLKEVKKQYNAESHQLVKQTLEECKISLAKAEQAFKTNADQLKKMEKELHELLKIKDKIVEETKKADELKEIESFIDISRDIFKDCGPLVGQFYIENISLEANNIYQEITLNASHNLSWALDYEIEIEENGLNRSFLNLSGGEQMAAALAVRLALLRELSDINIAFFDEPTTNMDEIRRSNLAEQIKNITSFDQLFVISHDDTFEQDIDNVIRLN